jgi:hypothetical protein
MRSAVPHYLAGNRRCEHGGGDWSQSSRADRGALLQLVHDEEERTMAPLTMTPFLRNALMIDAAASLLVGLPMAAAAHPLAALLGLPVPLLFWAGVICLPYAALLAMFSREQSIGAGVLIAIIVGNSLWVVACLLLAFAGWMLPTALGVGFLLVQAVFVGLFAELQWIGWRRAAAA